MNNINIDAVINHMVGIVHQHKFTLLEHSRRELLVHDRKVIERIAVPGASAAWMVGDIHTHVTQIGIHREANAHVGYFLKLANREDKFYRIDFGVGKLGFEFTELDRNGFIALQTSAVPYERTGYGPEFTLFKGGNKVGQCLFKCLDEIEHKYEVHISPARDATLLDRTALYEWIAQAIYGHGTLFARWSVKWHEANQGAELEAA